MRGQIIYGRNGKPLPGPRSRLVRPKTVLNELRRLSAIFSRAKIRYPTDSSAAC
jgi:hypothetical protein